MRPVRLKYAASINDEALPEATPGDRPLQYIDIGSVGQGYLAEPPENLLFAEAPSRARRLVRPGDTIVSTVRTYLRAVWPVTGPTDDLVVSTGFAVVRPRAGVDARYLGWVLQSDTFVNEVARRSVGVSYPAINPRDLGDIRVPIPPLAEQRRIAAYIDHESAGIDDVIERRSRSLQLLTERSQSVLEEELAALEAPEAKLRRFTRSIEQGVSYQAGSRPAGEDEWGVLKLSAVKWGEFHPLENKVLAPDSPVDDRLRPQPGDLLVTRSNTPRTVGDVCAVTEPAPLVLLPDLIYRLRLNDRLDSEFASLALRTSSARTLLSGTARGTSQSMVKLRGEDILNVVVPVLPIPAQRALVERVDNRIERQARLARMIQEQIAALYEHRSALVLAAVGHCIQGGA